MVADPKALQYILHTSGYNFPKAPDASHTIRMLTGDGVGCTKGELSRHKLRAFLENICRGNPSASEESYSGGVFRATFEGISLSISNRSIKGKCSMTHVKFCGLTLRLARTAVERRNRHR